MQDTLLALGSATLGESGAAPLAPRIRAAWDGARVAGPAYTVVLPPADNLAIHLATADAPAGSVLVVDATAEPARGYWGEVLTTAAAARGIAGVVIDGGVRDTVALQAHGFPVFAAVVALRGAGKAFGGSVGLPVTVGDAVVRSGDWVVGDRDGVVVIRAERLEDVLSRGGQRASAETGIFDALRAGRTTLDLLDLDPGPVARG